MNNPFYHEDNLKDEAYDEGWLTGEAIGGWLILILTEEKYFLFLIMIGEEITQVLMNIG